MMSPSKMMFTMSKSMPFALWEMMYVMSMFLFQRGEDNVPMMTMRRNWIRDDIIMDNE